MAFENKRIEMLEKRNKALVEDNKELNKRVKELEEQIKGYDGIIAAADTYTEEHRKAMMIAGEARKRYELAYRQMVKLKSEYEKRMEKVLKGFE